MTIKFVENKKNQIINQHPQKQKQENIPHSPSKKLTLQIRMGGGNGLGSLPHNEATASPTTGYHENHLRAQPRLPNAPSPPKEIASHVMVDY